MTTRNIVIAVIVVIVLVVIGWFIWGNGSSSWMMGSTASTTPAAQTTTDTTGGSTSTAGFKSLNDVVAQGGNYQCTIDIIDSGSRTTGTVYGTAGKTRLDLTIVAADGTNVITHIIRTGTTSYTWVDGQQTGVKASFSQGTSIVPQPSGGVATASTTGQFSSNCYPNVPNAANFVPPTGISFVAR